MKHRSVQRLPNNDPPACPTRDQLRHDSAENRLLPGCLGGGVVLDDGGGYGEHLRTVSIPQQGGGHPRALVEYLPHPGDPV